MLKVSASPAGQSALVICSAVVVSSTVHTKTTPLARLQHNTSPLTWYSDCSTPVPEEAPEGPIRGFLLGGPWSWPCCIPPPVPPPVVPAVPLVWAELCWEVACWAAVCCWFWAWVWPVVCWCCWVWFCTWTQGPTTTVQQSG